MHLPAARGSSSSSSSSGGKQGQEIADRIVSFDWSGVDTSCSKAFLLICYSLSSLLSPSLSLSPPLSLSHDLLLFIVRRPRVRVTLVQSRLPEVGLCEDSPMSSARGRRGGGGFGSQGTQGAARPGPAG